MNLAPAVRLLKRYHSKKLLVDTNLLLPYLLGCFYRARRDVPRHSCFKEDEFNLIAQIIHQFTQASTVVTTPHILTEVSAISKNLGENRTAFLSHVQFVAKSFEEHFDQKRVGFGVLSRQTCFPKFGLTDTAIINLAYDSILVLTNDRDMADYLRNQRKKRNVVFFGDLKLECLGN